MRARTATPRPPAATAARQPDPSEAATPAPAPPAPPAPLLAARGLSVSLGGVPVLRGVDITVRAGEIVGVVGPNGAGKSTLIRAATGLVPIEAGAIDHRGVPLAALSRRELARRVAVVQQLPEAPPAMRVTELVLLGRHPHLGLLGRESRRDHTIAYDAMCDAGCAELADRPLRTLSGGQLRRAFIARALAQQPSLLLLDEPTANLDVQAQAELFEVLRALVSERSRQHDGQHSEQHVGVLVVVHDLTLAAAYCDRVVLLSDGHVVASGAPARVLTADAVARVYGRGVEVIAHPRTGAPLVVPVVDAADAARPTPTEEADG